MKRTASPPPHLSPSSSAESNTEPDPEAHLQQVLKRKSGNRLGALLSRSVTSLRTRKTSTEPEARRRSTIRAETIGLTDSPALENGASGGVQPPSFFVEGALDEEIPVQDVRSPESLKTTKRDIYEWAVLYENQRG